MQYQNQPQNHSADKYRQYSRVAKLQQSQEDHYLNANKCIRMATW